MVVMAIVQIMMMIAGTKMMMMLFLVAILVMVMIMLKVMKAVVRKLEDQSQKGKEGLMGWKLPSL